MKEQSINYERILKANNSGRLHDLRDRRLENYIQIVPSNLTKNRAEDNPNELFFNTEAAVLNFYREKKKSRNLTNYKYRQMSLMIKKIGKNNRDAVKTKK